MINTFDERFDESKITKEGFRGRCKHLIDVKPVQRSTGEYRFWCTRFEGYMQSVICYGPIGLPQCTDYEDPNKERIQEELEYRKQYADDLRAFETFYR